MPKFTYKGKNIYGDITEGVFEAPSEQGVMDMLKSRNYYVLEVKPLIEKRDLLDFEANRKIPVKELMLFCKHFSVILKAGIPVLHALSMVEGQTDYKPMKKVISEIMKDIQMGSSLTQAVKNNDKKLPMLMIYMIEAGEASGTLDRSLDSLYTHFEKSYNTSMKIKSALRYPIIVSIVALIVTVFMMIVVVPSFTSLFEQNAMDLPGITKALIAISDFLSQLCGDKLVCARFGGDEFVAAGFAGEGEGAQLEIDFQKKIDEYNAVSKKPYKISASTGRIEKPFTGDANFDNMVMLADETMYRSKADKKSTLFRGQPRNN